MSRDWAARFPRLFAPRFETYANADLEFRLEAPPDELVVRLHLVALDPAGLVVVCRSVEEWRFLPGGRREPGEVLAGLARRELLEEAGCVMTGEPSPVFAYQRATSHNPAPHHAHFPHPVAAWAYAVARVEVTGADQPGRRRGRRRGTPPPGGRGSRLAASARRGARRCGAARRGDGTAPEVSVRR